MDAIALGINLFYSKCMLRQFDTIILLVVKCAPLAWLWFWGRGASQSDRRLGRPRVVLIWLAPASPEAIQSR